MSETKFTPGTWEAIKGLVEDDSMRCAVVTTRGKVQYLIATIENGAPEDFCETEEANAHLISAAPELFEVGRECQRILAILTAPANESVSISSATVWAQCVETEAKLRAALAKAIGQ
jgi:hypothetical protein